MKSTLRSFDLAHLAHVELLTPKPEQSLHFFVNVMGMTETARRGDSVYLRGWDDYEHHTLKLTASKIAGMGHVDRIMTAEGRVPYSEEQVARQTLNAMGYRRS